MRKTNIWVTHPNHIDVTRPRVSGRVRVRDRVRLCNKTVTNHDTKTAINYYYDYY